MSLRFTFVSAVLFAFLGLYGGTFGQNRVTTADKYLITARAGGVNLVEGDVTIDRAGRSGLLIKGDDVQIGERVTTGSDGRAEILMNPGSFVRLGTNSSFEFASTDLDNVRLTVHKGSAILEVLSAEGFQVDLGTDTARFTILETGVYRIDASPTGSTTVAVWKGKLRAGLAGKLTLGGGRIAAFDGKSYTVNKFDREDQDDLAVWSRHRSEELSKISSSLKPDALRDPLISSFYGGRWDLYRSFGLWVYNPFYSSYCFLPFQSGWNSPYGFGFGRSIWYYNLPVAIYKQPPPSDWRGRNPRVSVEPGRSANSARDRGTANDDRGRGNDDRKNGPRERPIEPRNVQPRIEPIMPAIRPQTKQPTKRP